MNLREPTGRLRRLAFRIVRATMSAIPGGRIAAFGAGNNMIQAILVVNLDRQSRRLRRMLRELGRFRTSDGAPLTSIVRRFAAVDARDGRAVAFMAGGHDDKGTLAGKNAGAPLADSLAGAGAEAHAWCSALSGATAAHGDGHRQLHWR